MVWVSSLYRCLVRSRNAVTTPKNPGPEPRAAQNRSAFSCSEHHTTSPEAVTTCMASIDSAAQPQPRQFQPIPPCSRKPPSPTVGQCPPAKNRPRAARNGSRSRPPRTAGPTVTVPVASS